MCTEKGQAISGYALMALVVLFVGATVRVLLGFFKKPEETSLACLSGFLIRK